MALNKIAVLSGKGGTGKTLIAVNLAAACGNAIYCDCDVEEPNGYLFFKPKIIEQQSVFVKIPEVDNMLCNGCKKCLDFCNFNALSYTKQLRVFEDVCHSCGGCAIVCPQRAISEKDKKIGNIQVGASNKITTVTGILDTGIASGVPIVKQILSHIKNSESFVFIDCPPGSACIVMESIKDADYCILVGEPTLFGKENLAMVYELVKLFDIPCGVVLNKCGEGYNPTEEFCLENNIDILIKIPYDNTLGELNSNGKIAIRENYNNNALFYSLLNQVKEALR